MVYEKSWRAKSKSLLPHHERWQKQAESVGLSAEGKVRLSWIIYAEMSGNVFKTCRHFGIGNSTFYKWKQRFQSWNMSMNKMRGRQVVPVKDERVIALRKQYPYFGKMKIKVIYEREYGETISSWYVQRVIKEYKLYFQKKKKHYTQRKTSQTKKRITECQTKPATGFLLHLDTIVLHLMSTKRYVITAIDDHSRIAYARMYKSHSSNSTKDFFQRLYFLLEDKIENVHTDNGSEFHKHFDQAITKLELTHWWSRTRTPKDNPGNERFNRTLREEFLNWGNFHPDTTVFNKKLTNWLVEYNSIRPHESLNYLTPLEYSEKTMHLSTMWSSGTYACAFLYSLLYLLS